MKKYVLTGILCSTLSSCYVEVKDSKDDDNFKTKKTTTQPSSDMDLIPVDFRSGVTTCQKQKVGEKSTLSCYQSMNRRWLTNCSQPGNCEPVHVSVNYLLNENVGTNKTVIVEAFRNNSFGTYPEGSLRIYNFDASRAGTNASDSMFLAPGDYTFRAYISNEDHMSAPMEYKGMDYTEQQMSNNPYGVFGASGLTSLHVRNEFDAQTQAPVIINLNRLYKKNGSEKPTHAHLLIKMKTPASFEAPMDKNIVIKLFNSDDFKNNPVYTYAISSNLFRIEGRKGIAEHVASELKVGEYFVQAFVDDSMNGYADAGEMQATYKKAGEAARIKITENRTETIELSLDK